MLHFVGRGSTEAKLQLHDMGNALCWAEGEVDYSLRAVHCYKHLGTWLQVGAKTAKEVAARGTAARQSWGVLHRAFYSKKYVSLKSKTMAFESLTLTRMLYNSHVWSPVTDDVVQRWQNSLRKPVGLIARGHTLGVSPNHTQCGHALRLGSYSTSGRSPTYGTAEVCASLAAHWAHCVMADDLSDR